MLSWKPLCSASCLQHAQFSSVAGQLLKWTVAGIRTVSICPFTTAALLLPDKCTLHVYRRAINAVTLASMITMWCTINTSVSSLGQFRITMWCTVNTSVTSRGQLSSKTYHSDPQPQYFFQLQSPSINSVLMHQPRTKLSCKASCKLYCLTMHPHPFSLCGCYTLELIITCATDILL